MPKSSTSDVAVLTLLSRFETLVIIPHSVFCCDSRVYCLAVLVTDCRCCVVHCRLFQLRVPRTSMTNSRRHFEDMLPEVIVARLVCCMLR
jgi:hypothetical protein